MEDRIETEVLAALTKAREDPKTVATRLKQRRYDGKTFTAERNRQTKEGAAACRDAMKYLETVPRTTPLAFAGAGLRLACEDHALDAGGRVLPRRALCFLDGRRGGPFVLTRPR